MKNIAEMSLGELEEVYINAIKKAEIAGKAWVEAKAFFESISDKEKPTLATLMGQFKPKEGEKDTHAAKEQYAYTRTEWLDYLSLVSDARKKYLQGQVDFDMSKIKIEALRTIISTRRTEIQTFRG